MSPWWRFGRGGGASPEPAIEYPRVEPPRTLEPERGIPPADLIRLSADGRQSVVGESFYQPALRHMLGGRAVALDFDAVPPFTGVLVPEPDNPHDANAVRVTASGRTVGYLPREVAQTYQGTLIGLLHGGRLGSCPLAVTGGGDQHYGAYLHLGPAERVVPVNAPSGLTLLAPDHPITVTGEERHQDVLAPILGGAAVVTVYASLVPATITSGKYSGQEGVEVQVGGLPVGALTKMMADRYASLLKPLWARSETPGCEAVVARSHRGFVELDLRLPAAGVMTR